MGRKIHSRVIHSELLQLCHLKSFHLQTFVHRHSGFFDCHTRNRCHKATYLPCPFLTDRYTTHTGNTFALNRYSWIAFVDCPCRTFICTQSAGSARSTCFRNHSCTSLFICSVSWDFRFRIIFFLCFFQNPSTKFS